MCHIFRDARKLSLSSSAMGNELLWNPINGMVRLRYFTLALQVTNRDMLRPGMNFDIR